MKDILHNRFFEADGANGGSAPEADKTTPPKPDGESGSKTYSEEEFKKAVRQRQEEKAKSAELEKRLLDLEKSKKTEIEEKQKEQGKYKELHEAKEKEIEELRKELESYKPYKEKYNLLETSIREELINQLPKEHHEIANDLSTDKLKNYVKLHSNTKVSTDQGKSGKPVIDKDKKYDDYNIAELQEIKKEQPQAYSKLYKDKYGFEPRKR